MGLFNIVVDIAASTANIESGIDRVVGKIESFGRSVQTIGEIVSIGLFSDMIKDVIDLGDHLSTAAQRAGVTGQAFSELVYDAKQSGVGVDQLSTAIANMNRQLSLASTGARQPTEALAALGLTIKDLKGLSPDQEFEVLADRISKLPTPADKARASMTLFGKSASELLPLLNQGAAGIEKLRQEAIASGATFNDETLKNLEEAHQSIDKLESSFSALAATLVGKVAPSMSRFLDDIRATASGDQLHFVDANVNRIQGALASLPADDLGTTYARAQLLNQLHAQDLIAGTNSLILRSDQLQSPSFAGLLGGGSPGYQPNPLDQLQPINVSNQIRATSSRYNLPGATAAPALLGQYDKDTIDQLSLAQQKLNDTQADLNVLLASGAISQDEYNTRLRDASAAFTNLLDTKLPEFKVTMQKMPEIMSAADMAIHDFVDTTKMAFEQTLNESGSFGKNLVRNLLEAFANKELLNAIDNLGTAMENALSKAGGTGGFLGFVSSLFGGGSELNSTSYLDSLDNSTSSYMNSLDYSIPGFATGGSFMVGGSGGTDSQLVQLRATPGERVSVTRPGQGNRGGDTYSIVVNATIGDVASRSDVVSGMEQAMNGAVAKIQDMNRRGSFKAAR